MRRGGSVVVVARESGPLAEAGEGLRALANPDGQFVDLVQADAVDRNDIGPKLEAVIARRGVPDYLINAVGDARPGYVTEMDLEDFRRQMGTNYFGQVTPTLAVLPHLVEAGRGHIAFVSSMMGYLGFIGYAAYAPSKFALVGLAEALRHELRPAGIKVSVLYPPDTDTPGFEQEKRHAPPETHMLSGSVKIAQPEDVARTFVRGIQRGKFHIFPSGAGLVWRLQRYTPTIVRTFLDHDLKKARRRVGKA